MCVLAGLAWLAGGGFLFFFLFFFWFFLLPRRVNKHTLALTNRCSPFFIDCCLHGFHDAQRVFPWTCSRLWCSARSLHSLMPSCDMVCGVSCLCSRLGLLGLSCGCFLIAWLCPVCEDTVLLRLHLLLGASVGGGRFPFFPPSEKRRSTRSCFYICLHGMLFVLALWTL